MPAPVRAGGSAVNAALALLVFVLSFASGLLFDDPRVGPLLRVLSLTFVLNSLATVPGVVIARLMRFRTEFWINLGVLLAISGADFLEGIGFTGIPLIIAFIIVSATINLFVGSASAKWALMAPVFVPMFMLLGYSPEMVQAAFRVGDSCTNIITPLMSYFPLILTFLHKYDARAGIGTLIATMLPYSVAFMVAWQLMQAGPLNIGRTSVCVTGPSAGCRTTGSACPTNRATSSKSRRSPRSGTAAGEGRTASAGLG